MNASEGPAPGAEVRRSKGAIPAHWTIPAEVSASAIQGANVQSDGVANGRARWLWLVVVLGGTLVGAFAAGVIEPPSSTGSPAVPDPEAAPTEPAVKVAPKAKVASIDQTKQPATNEVPAAVAAPTATRAGTGADEKRETSVEFGELPVRKKVKDLLMLGERHVRKGRYKEAVRVLEKAARLDPNYPRTQRSLGIARARLGDFAGARQAYSRYLQMAPQAADAADVRRILGQ